MFMCKFWYRHMFFIHGSKFTNNFKDVGSQKVQMKCREIWNCTHCCCRAVLYSIVSDSSQSHGLKPTSLLHPWNFPVKNTGMGCHLLLQEICLTQKLNLDILVITG